MNYYYFIFRTVVEDFKRNKTRTFLASLGILIGVLSVVMLIALGIGLRNYISGQFESLGSNLIFIMPGGDLSEGGFQSFGSSLTSATKFDTRDVSTLGRIPEIDYVVPMFQQSVVVEANGEKERGTVLGTTGYIFHLYNASASAGRLLTPSEGEKTIKDVVLGSELANKLFDDPSNAINKRIKIESQRYRVIGVMKSIPDPDMQNGIIIPYKTTFSSLNPDKTFLFIAVGVDDENKIDAASTKIEDSLGKRYDTDNFSVSKQDELLDIVNQIFGVINGVLIAIGSISLVVGGIGIMNIMYANVTERTKEIGIRRALGATQRDVLYQFLTESLLLSLFGGILGILIAALIVVLVHPFFPAAINLLSVVIAVSISSGIGIFFGVFPARRAAKLTPIEAIRYE